MLKFGQRFKAEDNNWRENDKYANYCYHSSRWRTVGMFKQQPNFALKFIFWKWTLLFLYKTFILSVEKESLWKILHQKTLRVLGRRATRSVHFVRGTRKHSKSKWFYVEDDSLNARVMTVEFWGILNCNVKPKDWQNNEMQGGLAKIWPCLGINEFWKSLKEFSSKTT